MPFRGRHKVYILFWPWGHRPFVNVTDFSRVVVSKSVGGAQSANIALFPRNVPTGSTRLGVLVRENASYLDVLHPNDWVFIIVDPQDGGLPMPLFFGFIDRVAYRSSRSATGSRDDLIDVRCSGWEKAISNTQCVSHPWLADSISIPNLISLGPGGSEPETEGTEEGRVGRYVNTVTGMLDFLFRTFFVANWKGKTVSNATAAATVEEETDKIEDTISTAQETEESGQNKDESGLSPIMGQYELPNSGVPLWNFIKIAAENIEDKVLTEPGMFLQTMGSSLSRMLDQYSNPPINMLIYDVRRVGHDGLSDLETRLNREVTGGYSSSSVQGLVDSATGVVDIGRRFLGELVGSIAPYVILRVRPLFEDELLSLEGTAFSEDDLSEVDLGPSDADHYNIASIDIPSLTLQSMARATSGFPGYEMYREETLAAIKRHGMRLYQETTSAWPGEVSAPLPNAALVRDWDLRLHRAGLDNVKIWSGQISLQAYVREIYLGGSVTIEHPYRRGVRGRTESRVYFVDGIDYNYTAGDGSFSTSVALTRGYRIGG